MLTVDHSAKDSSGSISIQSQIAIRTDQSSETPSALIASDGYRPEDSDFVSLPAVKAALKKTTFGHIHPDETVEAMFEAGLARELFPNCAVDENHPNALAWLDYIEPSFDHLSEVNDKQLLALLICDGFMYGNNRARRELILSVKDEGIFGALAQAKLQPPMTIRSKSPSWYRPFRPSAFRGQVPNLFTSFAEG